MKKSLIYLSLLVILSSCNKDPIQYTFEGTITEDQTGGPLEGATVSIYQKPFNNSVTTNNFDLAASAVTDANGYYTMTFDREKVTEFKVNIERDNYYKADLVLSSGDISSENNNTIDYEMAAESWIKFNIYNSIPAAENDQLNLLLINYKEGCEECATADTYGFGGIVDTSVKFASTAGQYFTFTHIAVGESSGTDSVYMTPFDTLFYSINY